jgi:uroporphyrinogen decarboxylase
MLKNLPVSNPKPDGKNFIDVLMGKKRAKPPLVEYLVDDVLMRPIVTELLGRSWKIPQGDRASLTAYLDNFIEFWYRMGYDFVRYEQDMGFQSHNLLAPDPAPQSRKDRAWADQHNGMITSWEDFEKYPWPKVDQADFFAYEYINDHLPDGMGLIVSHGAGIYEHLSSMMSYEALCLAVHDNPELVLAVSERIGSLIEGYYRHMLSLDRVICPFQGDDMGFRSGTLLAPDQLRKYSLFWHKRLAAMAHAHQMPYFLHSCGNLEKIMPDLIEDVQIDGKHSFEDAIIPVEDFQQRYGNRIAVLGGVDVHRLTTNTEEEVRKRVRFLMETCGERGRYAIGSGNSIPSYIPLENYLAMLDEALGVPVW